MIRKNFNDCINRAIQGHKWKTRQKIEIWIMAVYSCARIENEINIKIETKIRKNKKIKKRNTN